MSLKIAWPSPPAGLPQPDGYPLTAVENTKRSRDVCALPRGTYRHFYVDNKSNPERRSAIIDHELQKYNIDIAALSETRVHGNSQFEEAAAGYTFFLTGHPTDGPSQAGVVLPFAPHSSNALNRGLLATTRELCNGHSTILLLMLSQSLVHTLQHW